MSFQRIHTLILPFLVAGLFSGCMQSPEEKLATHFENGIAYFENEQFFEAIIEFKNVVKLGPKHAEGHYRLAQTYLKLGSLTDLQAAFSNLLITVQLDPENQDAQIKLGELYLLSQEPAKAKEQANIILASTPQSLEGLSLRGRSLLAEEEFQAGIEDIKKAIKKNPSNISLYLVLARAYAQVNNQAVAERTLRQALKTDPDSMEARFALGDFYVLTGHPDKGEAEYKIAIKTAPNNDTPFLKLSQFYRSTKNFTKAEAVYQSLAEQKPNEEKPQLYLGDYYAWLGQVDKAIARYQRAVDLNPDSSLARDKLINYYFDVGKVDEAEKLVRTIVEDNVKDWSGLFFEGRLKLANGKIDEAISLLHQAIKDEPRSALAHQALGFAYAKNNDLALASQELSEAVRLAPSLVEARTALAAVHLSQGSTELAIEQAWAAIRLHPMKGAAVAILGDAYLRKNDLPMAKKVFKAIVKNLPNNPLGHYRLGQVSQAEKDFTGALSHFEKALSVNADAVEPLSRIASIRLVQGKLKVARERVMRQLQSSPKNPLIFNLLGRLWMASKNPTKAEEAFRQAIDINPTLLASYLNLGELYTQSGKLDKAAQEFEAALATNPNIVSAHMVLGMIHQQRQEFEKAKTRYGQVLQLDPKFAPAANNLAWILIDQGGNSDLALSYARTARELQPDDPNIADTLGWIYYRKNVFLKATHLLKEATEKLPHHPVVQYHYGMALHKHGNAEEAKKALNRSLKISQTFSGAEEARNTLKTL